ncbi:MAG: hypothetical protein FWH26_04195 [Oscillospiraceae bacterium]|nr:hypothetical protein [Oscillospiraceae bacterium]
MKKLLRVFLVLLLCGAMTLGAAAKETPDIPWQAERFYEVHAQSNEEADEELITRGEALMRETLAVLTGDEFTIYHNEQWVLSYNGELFSSTFGIQRVFDLYSQELYYEVNRNFRIYFDLPLENRNRFISAKSVEMLYKLVRLEMPEEFNVREAQGAVIVDFEAEGLTFTFSYNEDGKLSRLRINEGSASFSLDPNAIETKAQKKLLSTFLMIRLPARYYDIVWALITPMSILFTIFWNLVSSLGIYP